MILCVVTGGMLVRCSEYKQRLIFTILSLSRSWPASGSRPLKMSQKVSFDSIKLRSLPTYAKHVSYMRFPISCCTWLIVSRSCLVTACPRNDSTLKLFVLAGKIKNATTVTSGRCSFNKWFKRASDSMKMSAPLLLNSYRPAMKKYNVLSRLKSKCP